MVANINENTSSERSGPLPPDLRPAGELAPSIALPWIVKLRYGVLAGQALIILLAFFVLEVELPLGWISIPLALVAGSNWILSRRLQAFSDRRYLGSLLGGDIICLTALLSLTGGPHNPLTLLYLVQITLSAVILSREWTWALGILSTIGYGFQVSRLCAGADARCSSHAWRISPHLYGMWIAFAAAALLITIFIGKVSDALRNASRTCSCCKPNWPNTNVSRPSSRWLPAPLMNSERPWRLSRSHPVIWNCMRRVSQRIRM